ncbi:hypothetical protein D3C75_1308140 [compost metagenome]
MFAIKSDTLRLCVGFVSSFGNICTKSNYAQDPSTIGDPISCFTTRSTCVEYHGIIYLIQSFNDYTFGIRSRITS